MSLVLSMRQGHDFYVNDTRVIVSWISSSTRFCLRLPDGSRRIVQDDKWYTLLDDVYVMAGTPKSVDQSSIVNVAIKAPKDMLILRGPLYREAKRKQRMCDTCKGSGTLRTLVLCENCSGHGCQLCKNGFIVETFKCPDCEV